MSDIGRLIWCALIGLFRSRAALQAEILILRHQLNVLRRKSPKRVSFSNIDLSLPEIKSERIDGANLRGADWPRCGQRPEQHATLVHPCSAIGAYERHCNIFGTIEAGGEGAARRTPRHDQGSPVVSSRSAFPYGHFAMVIAVRSADPGCPSHEDAGSKRHHKPHSDRE